MSYKIRRSKSHIQLDKATEATKIRQLEEIKILKQQIERIKLELHYKNCELQQIRESRYTEDEVYSIISTMLLNIDDTDELTKNLVVCDRLIKNVLAELQNAVEMYNSSFHD